MDEAILQDYIKNLEDRSELIMDTKSYELQWITGYRLFLLKIYLKVYLFVLIVRCYKNPLDWFKSIRYLLTLRYRTQGETKLRKMVGIKDKLFMGLYTPPLFTKNFDAFVYKRLSEFKAVTKSVNRFDMVYVSVTNNCPLRCEHCSNWKHLNTKNEMSSKKLSMILDKLNNYGVSLILFTGGEPILTTNKICEVVSECNDNTEYWVLTSGFALNDRKAQQLKTAGITGIAVSLDHHEEEKHNAFRHHTKSYYWVEKAIKNANANGLLTALSLCITPEFATEQHLIDYMELAKNLNVGYVQFLESKPVGHFINNNVVLSDQQLKTVEDIFVTYNSSKTYKKYPIIIYPGYYQRRTSCGLSGKNGLYIDAFGHINPCPFCIKSYGAVTNDDFDTQLMKMVNGGCSEHTC